MNLKTISSFLFGTLLDDRNKQLTRYNEQLLKLSHHKYSCSNTIIEFFLFQSKINQQRTSNLEITNIFEIKEILSQNLQTIEKDLTEFDKILESENICNSLKEYLRQTGSSSQHV